MSKQIQNWSDEFMFTAEKSDAVKGPEAFLISATPDPLGSIAVAAEAYMGRFYETKVDVTDEDREFYLREIQKTKLKMPLEAVSLHWRIKGVTRSFTHQMVRQRTAAYSQESMRFAVKEDLNTAVALPPSLQGFNNPDPEYGTYGNRVWEQYKGPIAWDHGVSAPPADRSVRQYCTWRETVEVCGRNYNTLVNDGMPAEEARGLSPHNTVTQLNYITNLRNYQDHAGNRLCTQAQFEWRLVWTRMLQAMRDHCSQGCLREHDAHSPFCDNWQWVAISEIFLPVCYQMGKCQFEAEFDRKCSIRSRVNANAEIGRSSKDWAESYTDGATVAPGNSEIVRGFDTNKPVFIGAIHPAEWLTDAGAAR